MIAVDLLVDTVKAREDRVEFPLHTCAIAKQTLDLHERFLNLFKQALGIAIAFDVVHVVLDVIDRALDAIHSPRYAIHRDSDGLDLLQCPAHVIRDVIYSDLGARDCRARGDVAHERVGHEGKFVCGHEVALGHLGAHDILSGGVDGLDGVVGIAL
jgi:hypothetical protein